MNGERLRQLFGHGSIGVSGFGSLLHRGSAVGDPGFPGPEPEHSVCEFSASGSAATGRSGEQSPPAPGYAW
jgi:hypothetical protein